MGLRAEFQSVPVDVFNEMGDVVLDCILRRYTTVYVPGGTNTPVETDYPIRTVEDEITDTELAIGSVITGDKKFLTPASELFIKPRPKDSVVDAEGVIWNIYRTAIDPAGALWTIYTRQ